MQADENDTSLSEMKSFMAREIILHGKVVWMLCDIYVLKSIVLFCFFVLFGFVVLWFVCLIASLTVMPEN